MTAPSWFTPSGFLGTFTERVFTSTNLNVIGDNLSLNIISGSLPKGLSLSNTGTISGVPFSVGIVTSNQFVVRAANTVTNKISDRTFIIDVQGPSEPIWVTEEGLLPVGRNSSTFAINETSIEYQLLAEYDILPPNQKLRYFIEDGDGSLPPGITLYEDGKISGIIRDQLSLEYQSSSSERYDVESYDRYPYNYTSRDLNLPSSLNVRIIDKLYPFYVTVSDGYASSKRLFKILVTNTSSLLAPQWITDTDLGILRADNRQVIKLDIFDPYPEFGKVEFNWTEPTLNDDGSANSPPPFFNLTSSTGVIYGNIPYQSAYDVPYKFTVRAKKFDLLSTTSTYTDRTFDLTVKGYYASTIKYITPTIIGSLAPGIPSTLYINAISDIPELKIEYKVISGNLPAGLTLQKDGTITGKIYYNSQTYFDRNIGGLTLDQNLTTIDRYYNFSVEAKDLYQSGAIEKEFSIKIEDEGDKRFTNIFVRPFMNQTNREYYLSLFDTEIFNTNEIYRPYDTFFGIQKDPKLTIEFGIEEANIADYVPALNNYFRRKRFYLGDLKSAIAKDIDGNNIYEIIYVDIIDDLENDDKISIGREISFSDQTIYPNSVENMRYALKEIVLSENVPITIDEYRLPLYMRTSQNFLEAPVGFIKVLPICYTLPGKSASIIRKIKATGFDFKKIDFEIDRIVVENSLDNYPGVIKIKNLEKGSGYTAVPNVFFSKPRTLDGTTATGYAVMELNSATIVNSGTNYQVGDIINVIGGTYTAQISFSATNVISGAIYGLSIINRGGYVSLPELENAITTSTNTGTGLILDLNFRVNGVNITDQGEGYTYPADIEFVLTTGSVITTATAICETTNGYSKYLIFE